MTVTQYAGPAGAGQRYQITAPGGHLQLSGEEMTHLRQAIAMMPGSRHRGIEIRATLTQVKPNGLILLSNSDVMHLQALMGSPTALAEESGWTETLPPVLDGQGRPWLAIEHRAVMLPDYVPDPECED